MGSLGCELGLGAWVLTCGAGPRIALIFTNGCTMELCFG